MDRRKFLKASLASTAAGSLVSVAPHAFAQAGKPPTVAFFVKTTSRLSAAPRKRATVSRAAS